MSGETEDSWRVHLLFTASRDNPQIKKITANAITFLAFDPDWAGVLAYDDFAETIVSLKPPPWRKHDSEVKTRPGDWTDEDTIRVQSWLASKHTLDIGLDATLAAIKIVSRRVRVHPVRDWLSSLRWDGTQRLPTWLTTVMGCDDTPYVRAVGQAWAISAVARAFQPGCKVDTVLVLEGKPGTFKSSVLRALAGDAWFLEMSVADIANKDAMQVLRRKWIVEFPEVDGYSKQEQSHLKSYLSRQVDTYRGSYERGARDYPRQIAAAATTNKSEYLADDTGGTGRRMWPVKCRNGDVTAAASIREQFWAEARARFESAEAWHIKDPGVVEMERAEQEARFKTHPWEETIEAWLAKPLDLGVSRAAMGVTTVDVLSHALNIDVGKHEQSQATVVGSILRRLGWAPKQVSRNGARVRIYKPECSADLGGVAQPEQPEQPLSFLPHDRPIQEPLICVRPLTGE